MKYFSMIEERFTNMVCVRVSYQINTTEYKIFGKDIQEDFWKSK